MSYHSKMEWRSGSEIDAQIDRIVFELQANEYAWTKKLSVKPRRCYWTGESIRPFSYAMVAEFPSTIIDYGSDLVNSTYPVRWISMSAYVYLRLRGKI